MLNTSRDHNQVVDVLVAGRSAAAVRDIENMLNARAELRCTARLMTNGHGDVLAGLRETPDVVVLCCGDGQTLELAELAAMEPEARPAVIVCGSLTTAEEIRLAVRCGAADLLPESPDPDELLAALARAARQPRAAPAVRTPGGIVAVVGAAGGVGASFIACNLAHLGAVSDGKRVALVDLDLVYAPLAQFLGLMPERGLPEAAAQVHHLDVTAMQAYMASHASGLNLLSTSPDSPLQETVDPEAFRGLLQLLTQAHDRVVVDARRWLDGASQIALTEAQHVLLVLEQSVSHVHAAARLYRILTQQLGVPRERICVVLNRYSKRATVQGADVARAIGCSEPIEVPNEYGLTLSSLDSAIPMFDLDRKSLIARALLDINGRTGGTAQVAGRGFLGRTLPIFKRSLS